MLNIYLAPGTGETNVLHYDKLLKPALAAPCIPQTKSKGVQLVVEHLQ